MSVGWIVRRPTWVYGVHLVPSAATGALSLLNWDWGTPRRNEPAATLALVEGTAIDIFARRILGVDLPSYVPSAASGTLVIRRVPPKITGAVSSIEFTFCAYLLWAALPLFTELPILNILGNPQYRR